MKLTKFLETLIPIPSQHALWLNTLSYLEHCGARKIAACHAPEHVRKEILKHAAEEFRHASYLKHQIQKVVSDPPFTYARTTLLGGWHTVHYLDRLEAEISRLSRRNAYVLVTYAIEKRAESLYPLYQILLKKHSSKVSVKSILLEEKEHLEEMEREIKKMDGGTLLKELACEIEEGLYLRWIDHLMQGSRL